MKLFGRLGRRSRAIESSHRPFIEGLETRQFLSASVHHVGATPDSHVLPNVTNTVAYGYTPAQMRHAYGFDTVSFSGGTVNGDGKGQTIAIVDAYDDPNIASDLSTFDSHFGVAALDGQNGDGTFTVVKPSTASTNSGWSLETALDVEWAHAIAPKANIVLVEANSSGLGDLLSAVNTARNRAGVTTVSMSWGSGEFSSETAYDSYFTTPAGHAGITFVASSGDNGAPVEWPAASPNVLAVGGTSLKLDSSGNYLSETGWSGSGGGISAYESKPSYQSGVTQSVNRRTSPDVSYNADPNTGVAVYDTVAYNGQTGWFQMGGTSAGAPQWAALVAIADQGRATIGKSSLDGRSQTIPAVYRMSSSVFHDVTSGTSTGSPNYTASAGYDLVTGLGSPRAGSVIQQLLATT